MNTKFVPADEITIKAVINGKPKQMKIHLPYNVEKGDLLIGWIKKVA